MGLFSDIIGKNIVFNARGKAGGRKKWRIVSG